MRTKEKVLAAVLVAASTAAVLAPQQAVADPAANGNEAPRLTEHVGHLKPTAPTGRASGGGGRSGDFTGDGVPDILARDNTWGDLWVYPHSGTYAGTATFPRAEFVNSGWGGYYHWIGAADLNGDGFSDVVAIDQYGAMTVVEHSGTFGGTGTLKNGRTLINANWHINDLVFVFDFNADGFDDLLARRAGTGDTYVYLNNGGITGETTLAPPQRLIGGGQDDVFQGMADVTLDGTPDLVWVQDNGVMGAFSFADFTQYALGYGWETIDTVVLTEVDRDGIPDLLGRRAANGRLLAYTHTGKWAPALDDTAYDTWRAPVLVGTNWGIHNIIT